TARFFPSASRDQKKTACHMHWYQKREEATPAKEASGTKEKTKRTNRLRKRGRCVSLKMHRGASLLPQNRPSPRDVQGSGVIHHARALELNVVRAARRRA
uniref:Uncharacterized protein n=2 Tax=Ixodes scapularis TaxID=6945 RepID=A0A1S4M4U4_IXOSC